MLIETIPTLVSGICIVFFFYYYLTVLFNVSHIIMHGFRAECAESVILSFGLSVFGPDQSSALSDIVLVYCEEPASAETRSGQNKPSDIIIG